MADREVVYIAPAYVTADRCTRRLEWKPLQRTGELSDFLAQLTASDARLMLEVGAVPHEITHDRSSSRMREMLEGEHGQDDFLWKENILLSGRLRNLYHLSKEVCDRFHFPPGGSDAGRYVWAWLGERLCFAERPDPSGHMEGVEGAIESDWASVSIDERFELYWPARTSPLSWAIPAAEALNFLSEAIKTYSEGESALMLDVAERFFQLGRALTWRGLQEAGVYDLASDGIANRKRVAAALKGSKETSDANRAAFREMVKQVAASWLLKSGSSKTWNEADLARQLWSHAERLQPSKIVSKKSLQVFKRLRDNHEGDLRKFKDEMRWLHTADELGIAMTPRTQRRSKPKRTIVAPRCI